MSAMLPAAAQRLGAALAELGGEATPGELGSRAGYSGGTQAKGVRALHAAGLVEGTKARMRLTAAGRALFANASPPIGAGAALDAAGAVWGAAGYAHRALLELTASAIVGRYHLAPARPRDPQLVAVAVGNTRTGKTALGDQLCHLFGLDATMHQRLLRTMTEGEMLGRRRQTNVGMVFDPAPTLSLPFLLLDEYEKAAADVRHAADILAQGQYLVPIEGKPVEIRPTVLLALNPADADRLGKIHEAYQRRAAVLDTGYAAGRLDDLNTRLRDYYASHPSGPLNLPALRPPATALPAAAFAIIDSLREELTEAGRMLLPDERALEIAALGRAALLGAGDDVKALQSATLATCVSYLQVSETTPGQVRAEWYLDAETLRGQLGSDATGLARALAEGRRGRELAHRQVAAVRVRREATDLGMERRRGELLERLRQAREQLDGRHMTRDRKPAAAGIRRQLDKLRTDVAACKTAARLDELAELAAGPLDDAARLVYAAAADRAETQRQRQEKVRQAQTERANAAAQRRLAKASRAAQQQQATTVLAQVRELAKQLEAMYRRQTTKPGENPLDALAAVRLPDGRRLLVYEPPSGPAPEPPHGLFARVGRAIAGPEIPAGIWCSPWDARVRYRGWEGYCSALAKWGPETRAVLAPALAALHAAEDQLVAGLGRAPRASRPSVGWAPQQQAIGWSRR